LPYDTDEREEVTSWNSPFCNTFGQRNPIPMKSTLPRYREV